MGKVPTRSPPPTFHAGDAMNFFLAAILLSSSTNTDTTVVPTYDE